MKKIFKSDISHSFFQKIIYVFLAKKRHLKRQSRLIFVGYQCHSHSKDGTDGSRLSFMGLPCPNLFAGEQGIHSRHEHVSIQDMEKTVEMIEQLCAVWEEKS